MLVQTTILFALSIASFQANAEVVKDGRPSEATLRLTKVTKVRHNGTLAGITEATQKQWLRAGPNAMDLRRQPFPTRSILEPIWKDMGLTDSVSLSLKSQKIPYGLVAGGFIFTMAERLNQLLQELKQNHVKVENLLILSGDRDRDLQRESLEQVQGLAQRFSWLQWPKNLSKRLHACEHEADLAQLLLDSVVLDHRPYEKVGVVYAPKKLLPNGTLARPSTSDTVRKFASSFKPGAVILATSQPFGEYMFTLTQKILGDDYNVTLVASRPYYFDQIPTPLIFDYIARTLYVHLHPAEKL